MGTRFTIIDGEDDDVESAQMVERDNAIIVIDDHCWGTGYFWKESVEDAGCSASPPSGLRACLKTLASPLHSFAKVQGLKTGSRRP